MMNSGGEGGGLTSDMGISDAVSRALQSDGTTAGAAIDVAAAGTTVTLSGSVANQQTKERAEAIARGVGSVVDVDNELVVGGGRSGLFGGLGGGTTDEGTGVAPVVPLAGAGSGSGGGGGALAAGATSLGATADGGANAGATANEGGYNTSETESDELSR